MSSKAIIADLNKDIDSLKSRTWNGGQFFALTGEIPTSFCVVVIRIRYANFLSLLMNQKTESSDIGITVSIPQRKQMVKIKNVVLPLLSDNFTEVRQNRGTLLLKNYKRDFLVLKSDLEKIIEAFSTDENFSYHLTFSEPPGWRLE